MDNGFIFQLVRYKCNACHSYMDETPNFFAMQEMCPSRSAHCIMKSLARIIANYNLHVQIPVSFHSCLVSEDTNMRRSVTCALQKRTGNLKYPATTVNRVFVLNTASIFVFSARNQIHL